MFPIPDSSCRPHPPPPAPPALMSPSNLGYDNRHSVNSFSSATGSINNLDPDAFTFATVTPDGCTGRENINCCFQNCMMHSA